MTIQKIEGIDKPFHVLHPNGDIIAGFNDQQSAMDDADDRNIRACQLGLKEEIFYSWSRP